MRDRNASAPFAKPVRTSDPGGPPTPRRAPPLVSIITINLNDAAGLERTAQSVTAQTCTDFEWLIIDGGSTDRSIDVIRAFRAHLAGWSSEPDRGVYDAMNRGLGSARGKHVIFMNGGDRFADAHALARLAGIIARPVAPDLVFAGTLLEWPFGARLYRAPRSPERFVRFGLPAYHQAIAIRRDLHLDTPFDLRLVICAEYAAIASMLMAGASWQLMDVPLAIRHCAASNLSERRSLRRFYEFARIQRAVLRRGWPGVGLSLARQIAVDIAYRAVRGQVWPGSRRLDSSRGWRMLQRWLAAG